MDTTFVDSDLLNFSTYEDYLDSFVTRQDIEFLRSTPFCRLKSELGYNSPGVVLSKDEFEDRKQYAKDMLMPSARAYVLYSQECDHEDEVLRELAARERPNRLGILQTIVFLRHTSKKGREISGYIDFEWSLRRSKSREQGAVDWKGVFKGEKHLWPTPEDLSYCDWNRKVTFHNNTNNYKVLVDVSKGLIFLNRHDRKTILPDPSAESPGISTTRTVVFDSKRYNHCVFYDHTVRKMT